ncbi:MULTISPECIES: hypothetical protein [unclassified Achromobacter]|uniref:hypothetical protein n=1 Tax=unclassified Achromobacter TaxID=2626865 RepID=UPI000B51CD7D|nr:MULTISPECIES: hypothetical protein [unclassified Achromobacter]OWT74945.1 hypothetical protein CEY04_20470 [Achromobacter sp. HZ28]OWT76553.1 hypothetical protein CEY05_15925 [Achromobacter sp. HZ34]
MPNGGELKSSNVVLVLGMHRSGTSAISACLERLGVVMGSTLAKADEWNPKGYFEEREIVSFNDHLFDLAGCRWDSPLPPGRIEPAEWGPQAAQAATLLEKIFGGAPVWGFKDPRMCLLQSFWQPVFDSMLVAPKLLFVLRHPAEVAHSLARRDGISSKRAGWLWFTHLIGGLDYVSAESDCRLVDFSDLMNRPVQVMNDLCRWLDLTCEPSAIAQFSAEFISPQLSHGADAGSAEIPPLVLRAYDYWREVASSAGFSHAALHAPEWLQIREEFEHDIKPGLSMVGEFLDGDRQLAVADARLKTLSDGLAVAERFAVERLEKMTAMDAQLKLTSAALASVEKLAMERLQQVEKLNQQLQQVSEAYTLAERLALERLAALDKHQARS